MTPTPRSAPVTVKAEGWAPSPDDPSTAIPPGQSGAPESWVSPGPSGPGNVSSGRLMDEDKSAPARPSYTAYELGRKIDRLLELAEAEEARRLEAEEWQRLQIAAQMEALRRTIDRMREQVGGNALTCEEWLAAQDVGIVEIPAPPRPWWRFW